MAKKLYVGRYSFRADERTIILPGNVAPERLLLVTNINTNEILYNFTDPTRGFSNKSYDFDADETSISFDFDTTSMNDTDELQILVEEDSSEITAAEDLLDPVGKFRVSNPENLIDTDFEYGLQATKWETIQTVNNIPTIYSNTGDTPLDGIVSVEARANSKNIRVETNIPHGLAIGDPISVQGLSQYQAEGFFIVTAVDTDTVFFYETDVPTTFSGDISGSYTSIVPGKFFEGSTLPVSTADGVNTDAASPSNIGVTTAETHGFTERTKVYIRNSVGPRELLVADSTLVAPDNRPFVDTVPNFTESLSISNSSSTGRGSFNDRATTTYDWESTYTFYLDPSAIDTTNDRIQWNSHGLRNGYTVLFNTPYHNLSDGGMDDGSVYYVNVIDSNNIELHNNDSLTSRVNLTTLNNDYGKARLGLVYKVESADGVKRFTEAFEANNVTVTAFTQQDGGQIISLSDGPTNINVNVDVSAALGGNPTSVRINEFLIAGDFNSSFETITVTIGGTTITSSNNDQSGTFSRMTNDTFSGFDVSPFLFTSGGRTFFNLQASIPGAVDDLNFFNNPEGAARINMQLENLAPAGGGGSIQKEFSGGDLYDSQFGLGGASPTALIAFQGRTRFSGFSNFRDQFSFLNNQRENGRYGVLSVKYPNQVTGIGTNGTLDASFDIDLVNNRESYGAASEIFYIFARPISADRNTVFSQNHGIPENENIIVTVTVNTTDFNNGDRFAFADSQGQVFEQGQTFSAAVTNLNQDIIRLTLQGNPNTDDIARVPVNYTLSYTRENPTFNSIFVANHKVRGNTSGQYFNLTGDPIPPLTDGSDIQLIRVNDNRLIVQGPPSNVNIGTATTTIGDNSNISQTFFIPASTELGFNPSAATLNTIEFRGDMGASTEFIDIQFDDGDAYRIGENDDIGDSTTFTQSTTFSSKNVSQLLFDNGGVIGFNITVDPSGAVNYSPINGSSDWWQLRLNYEGEDATFLLEGPGTGSHEFLVNNLVGAYDGVFEIQSIDSPSDFTMASDFKIPQRVYEFTSANVNTGDNSIQFNNPTNMITGEKIVYNNNGNTDMLPTGGGNEFFAIVVNDTTIKVASSNVDALNNISVPITLQSGTHNFISNNIIKNIKGNGTVSTDQGGNVLIGTGTSFLTNFKRFDKIYINNGSYVEEKTVDTITTPEKMTIFETFSTTVSDVDYYYATQLALRPDGYSLHLPFDGGVDITAGTSPNSKIVRQSRKYFRYQSGKGIQNSFAINFNPPKLVRELIKSAGNIATIVTQEQHNLEPGDGITIDGATVSTGTNFYNGTFVVDSTPDEFTFQYVMQGVPTDVRAGGFPTFVRTGWTDSFIRAGMFDDQNGFFFEYDGQDLYAVRRSSTQQIAGSVNVSRGSQVVTGNGTSFDSQLAVGDRIVIRGQTYFVVEVSSDQRLVVQPAYRGVDGSRVKITKTIDTRTPQRDWNIDPADGTGFTGYDLNINKIQMAYIDYSWYGAGKIRYGFKDNRGHIRYLHEYKHNNRLNESYFRSGNLPGRYEIENGSAATTAPTLFHFGTSIIMDGRFDDDKAYQFNGQSQPFAFTNGASSTITSNAESVFEQVTLEGNRVFVYSIPVDEATAQTITEGLQIQVSGSDALPAGTYVTQVRIAGANSRIFTSFPATSNDPTGGTNFPPISANTDFVAGEIEPVDLTRPLPLISVRLAPSVDSSVTGALGEREIVNRMQLRLQQASVTANTSIEVFLLQNALPSTIEFEKAQRPSLSEVIRHRAGDTLLEGTTIFSTKASSGSLSFGLEELLEIGNSILGGDGIFPAGPDLLTLAVQPQNTSEISGQNPFFVTGKVSWSESQA